MVKKWIQKADLKKTIGLLMLSVLLFALVLPMVPTVSAATTTCTITMLPSSGSSNITSANCFLVEYLSGASYVEDYICNNTAAAFTVDQNTKVNVSAISNGSTATEVWMLENDQVTNGSITVTTSPKTQTYYYYDCLKQTAKKSITGGGTQTLTLSYKTAPDDVGATDAQKSTSLTLSTSDQYVWSCKGSTTAYLQTVAGATNEGWNCTGTYSWTISSANQITSPMVYYHQWALNFSYDITGGGSGYSAPTLTTTQFGVAYAPELTTSYVFYWCDNNTAWALTNPLSGSTDLKAWTTATTASGTVYQTEETQFIYAYTSYTQVPTLMPNLYAGIALASLLAIIIVVVGLLAIVTRIGGEGGAEAGVNFVGLLSTMLIVAVGLVLLIFVLVAMGG